MGEKIKNTSRKLVHSDKFIWTFLRSAASSQAASWVDMLMGFVLFAWVGMTAFVSTAIGAVAGGVINCIINYKYTFHAKGCPWVAVAVKYLMVWVGSLLLNSYGTQWLYYVLDGWDRLQSVGFNSDGCYAVARVTVSLLVSWFWNFVLQRYFVYRPLKFDDYIVSVFNVKTKKKS